MTVLICCKKDIFLHVSLAYRWQLFLLSLAPFLLILSFPSILVKLLASTHDRRDPPQLSNSLELPMGQRTKTIPRQRDTRLIMAHRTSVQTPNKNFEENMHNFHRSHYREDSHQGRRTELNTTVGAQ